MFEVVVDVGGGLKIGEVFRRVLGLAKQSAHPAYYVMIIASIPQRKGLHDITIKVKAEGGE